MRHVHAFERRQQADAGVVDQGVDGPGLGDAAADAVGIGHIERQHAQAVRRRQQALARGAHGGDDAPALGQKEARGFEAKAGRAAGDEDGGWIGGGRHGAKAPWG